MVVPEDEPYRKTAKGFEGIVPEPYARRIHVMPEAGGWLEAVKQVEADLHKLRRYSDRRLLLLIDFDGDSSRRDYVFQRLANAVQAEVLSRVYLLASLKEAEDLTRPEVKLGNYASIGSQIGIACQSAQADPWQHTLLNHNQAELARLSTFARPLLFGA